MQVDETLEQKLAHVLEHSYGNDSQDADFGLALNELRDLAAYPVTIALLSQTGAGALLAKLSKDHPDETIREAALAVSAAWRSTITIGSQLGHYLQQRGKVSVPSSSCAGLLPMFTENV